MCNCTMNPRTHNLHNLKMWCTIWMLRSHSFFALWTCEWRCSNSWHLPWHWRRLAFPGYKVRNSFHVTDLCLTIQLQASRKTSLYSIFYINMYIYISLHPVQSCSIKFSPRFSQSRAVHHVAMNFCPFPHSLRDQVWLAVGVGVPAAVVDKIMDGDKRW